MSSFFVNPFQMPVHCIRWFIRPQKEWRRSKTAHKLTKWDQQRAKWKDWIVWSIPFMACFWKTRIFNMTLVRKRVFGGQSKEHYVPLIPLKASCTNKKNETRDNHHHLETTPQKEALVLYAIWCEYIRRTTKPTLFVSKPILDVWLQERDI